MGSLSLVYMGPNPVSPGATVALKWGGVPAGQAGSSFFIIGGASNWYCDPAGEESDFVIHVAAGEQQTWQFCFSPADGSGLMQSEQISVRVGDAGAGLAGLPSGTSLGTIDAGAEASGSGDAAASSDGADPAAGASADDEGGGEKLGYFNTGGIAKAAGGMYLIASPDSARIGDKVQLQWGNVPDGALSMSNTQGSWTVTGTSALWTVVADPQTYTLTASDGSTAVAHVNILPDVDPNQETPEKLMPANVSGVGKSVGLLYLEATPSQAHLGETISLDWGNAPAGSTLEIWNGHETRKVSTGPLQWQVLDDPQTFTLTAKDASGAILPPPIPCHIFVIPNSGPSLQVYPSGTGPDGHLAAGSVLQVALDAPVLIKCIVSDGVSVELSSPTTPLAAMGVTMPELMVGTGDGDGDGTVVFDLTAVHLGTTVLNLSAKDSAGETCVKNVVLTVVDPGVAVSPVVQHLGSGEVGGQDDAPPAVSVGSMEGDSKPPYQFSFPTQLTFEKTIYPWKGEPAPHDFTYGKLTFEISISAGVRLAKKVGGSMEEADAIIDSHLDVKKVELASYEKSVDVSSTSVDSTQATIHTTGVELERPDSKAEDPEKRHTWKVTIGSLGMQIPLLGLKVFGRDVSLNLDGTFNSITGEYNSETKKHAFEHGAFDFTAAIECEDIYDVALTPWNPAVAKDWYAFLHGSIEFKATVQPKWSKIFEDISKGADTLDIAFTLAPLALLAEATALITYAIWKDLDDTYKCENCAKIVAESAADFRSEFVSALNSIAAGETDGVVSAGGGGVFNGGGLAETARKAAETYHKAALKNYTDSDTVKNWLATQTAPEEESQKLLEDTFNTLLSKQVAVLGDQAKAQFMPLARDTFFLGYSPADGNTLRQGTVFHTLYPDVQSEFPASLNSKELNDSVWRKALESSFWSMQAGPAFCSTVARAEFNEETAARFSSMLKLYKTYIDGFDRATEKGLPAPTFDDAKNNNRDLMDQYQSVISSRIGKAS